MQESVSGEGDMMSSDSSEGVMDRAELASPWTSDLLSPNVWEESTRVYDS